MPFKSGPRKAEKDEKGETVYACLWVGCTKTFGTAGHVRRHEKTHVGTTPYACPYCDKSFGRSDVRAKHVTTMHPEVAGSGIGGSGAGYDGFGDEGDEDLPPAKARRFSMNDAPGTVSRRLSSSSDTGYPPFIPGPPSNPPIPVQAPIPPPPPPSSTSALDHLWAAPQSQNQVPVSVSAQGQGQGQGAGTGTGTGGGPAELGLTPMTAALSSPSISVSMGGPAGMMMMPPPVTTGTPFSVPSVSSSSSGFIDPAQLSVGPSTSALPPDMLQGTMDGGLPFDPSWEWFGHVFGWGSDENIDLDIGLQSSMFEKGGVGPVSSTDTLSAAWLLCATPRGGSPVNGEDGKDRYNGGGPGQGNFNGMPDPFGRTHDNPWPNVFKPKVPDRPLTLAGVKASPRPHRQRNNDLISETSRNAMLSLIYLSHQPHWLMPDVDDFPDHETLSDFVDLYFEKFHPLFPVIHKPSFSHSDTPAVLLLSIAAVGATYAEPEFRPLAIALCELVRRMIAWMRGSDQRAKFDKNALLAFLLQTALGVACGSRELFYHAEIFRCSIVTTCRRLHLLRTIGSAMDDLYAKEERPSDEARYRAYLDDESKRRLGWAVYMLDSLMATLLHIPAVLSVKEAAINLPSDELLWEAPTAESWANLINEGLAMDPRAPRPKFLKVLAKSLAGEDPGLSLDDFGCGIISVSVWRMLMDQQMLQRALGVGLTDNGMDMPTFVHESHVLDTKPAHLLMRLAQTTYLSPSPSHLRLTPAALYHSAHLHFTRPGLVDRIRHISGRFEPDMTNKGTLAWLKAWVKNGKEVRRVLWHAGVLNALLAEFPRGSFSELFWTFDCALVVWAVVKYAPHQISSSGLRSALFAANWFDTTPPELWVSHGGQIVFPFLGSSSTWTVSHLLDLFMGRLESMPWGLAVQYRLVLNNLLEVEKGTGKVQMVDGGRPSEKYGEGKENYE
ncbi:hypothetical protein IAT40_003677 [Kwoniella sp. CBS 6097]